MKRNPDQVGERCHARDVDWMAGHLRSISRRQGQTPVLVVDHGLWLQPAFWCQLSDAVIRADQRYNHAPRPVRFDVLLPMPNWRNWISQTMHQRWVRRCDLALSGGTLGPMSGMQISIGVGRPGGALRHFVIGVTRPNTPLPSWCHAIACGTTVTHPEQWQLVSV
ncbi:MAG: hypothetical protein AAFP90_03935 [Planctomycetota bacterium]